MAMASAHNRRIADLITRCQTATATLEDLRAQSMSLAEWVDDRLSFIPDPWQRTYLESDHKRHLLLCARQTGKSTVVGTRAAAEAATRAGSRILIIGPSFRQALLLLDRARDALIEAGEVLIVDNRDRITLANGSELIGLPGDDSDKCRGFDAVTHAICDEACFIKDNVIRIITPMLATVNGALTLLSSPSAPKGVFHRSWTTGTEDWHRTKVFATECPRYNPELLADIKMRIGDVAYRSEYELEFVSSGDSYFSQTLIDSLFAPKDEPSPDWISSL